MKNIEQIIFDELAAQNPIFLEEVGYLHVENIPARMKGKNSVSAPRNVVIYTPDTPNTEIKNIINILEAEGTDYQQARDEYYAWLAEAFKDGTLTIAGAGILKNSVFSPTKELDKALNPNSQVVAVKRKNNTWLWILLILVLLAVLLFGYKRCSEDAANKKQPVVTESPTPVEPEPEITAEPEPQQEEEPAAGFNYPVPGRFYVVSGVFDIPSNADKQIAELKREFPDLTFEKFDYPEGRQGRTMVTVYSSTRRGEALDIRREMAWSYDFHDYWIYPEDK